VKTAISIPDPLFKAAERTCKRLGMSRSEFYSKAVEAFVKANRAKGIKEALDAVYDAEDSGLDPVLMAMQLTSLEHEDW
jgi:metal-responsive CopG/Arc/MetJ family transcriptional regulator